MDFYSVYVSPIRPVSNINWQTEVLPEHQKHFHCEKFYFHFWNMIDFVKINGF